MSAIVVREYYDPEKTKLSCEYFMLNGMKEGDVDKITISNQDYNINKNIIDNFVEKYKSIVLVY